MNPSAAGWIEKFGEITSEIKPYQSFTQLYSDLKTNGFVYGLNVAVPFFIPTGNQFTDDEKAKINLLTALFYTHALHTKQHNFEAFISVLFNFYKALAISNISFLDKILTGKKSTAQLEKLIHSRVVIETNVFYKAFNSMLTNSLLCIDVFAFKQYMIRQQDVTAYAAQLERNTINTAQYALRAKNTDEKDNKLAQLFAASLTFSVDEKEITTYSNQHKLTTSFTPEENLYFLDIASLSLWEDLRIDSKESTFIYNLGKELKIAPEITKKSLEDVAEFIDKNKSKIPHLKGQNLAQQFYDNSAKVVKKLIQRNSKRLVKELAESKELVLLLSKSTVQELTPMEKKKIQDQLLDIFKSIPSLAIFLLPGGAILLPIFVKLIPKLLPSAFDDNRLNNE